MNDVDFCKAQLQEIAELTHSPEKLAPKVQAFMKSRMPVQPAHRASLKDWAQAELAKLESAVGSGVTKLVATDVLAETSRRMAMLQIVIRQLDAARRHVTSPRDGTPPLPPPWSVEVSAMSDTRPMTPEQAATLRQLAKAAYELDAFKPNLTRAEADLRIAMLTAKLKLLGGPPHTL